MFSTKFISREKETGEREKTIVEEVRKTVTKTYKVDTSSKRSDVRVSDCFFADEIVGFRLLHFLHVLFSLLLRFIIFF